MNGTQGNAVGPTQAPIVVVIYTTGDTTRASGGTGSTVSDAFKLRAGTLASSAAYVIGKDTIDGADGVVAAITATIPAGVPIGKVYFLGHGTEDAFFTGGRPPDPTNPDEKGYVFVAPISGERFTDPTTVAPYTGARPPSKSLLDKLAEHFIPKSNPVEIGFLCCDSGINLVAAVAQDLSGRGFTGTVGGYNMDYRTNRDSDGVWRDIIQPEKGKTGKSRKASGNAPPSYDTHPAITP